MVNFKKLAGNLFLFSEPDKYEYFILRETDLERSSIEKDDMEEKGEDKFDRKCCESDKAKAKKLSGKGQEDIDRKNEAGENSKDENKPSEISKKLSENLAHIKKVYNIPKNGDVILREFDIIVKEKVISAFAVFIDGMTDRKVINDNILQPLMLLSSLDIKDKDADIAEYVHKHLIPQNQLKVAKEYEKIIDEVNFGGCAVFVDGIDVAFTADVKGWEHRGVERPNTELVIRGPQEGFVEILRMNTALVRKILKDEHLIVENLEIGNKSKTPCALMYIKDICNEELVDEVRKRLKSIKVDYVLDSGEVEQLIEDSPYMPSPQIASTERPDRVASMLAEGKVAIVVHGSPFVLTMPTTFHELIHSPEDSYIRFPYANLLRIIRVLGIVLSLLLPGLWVAVTNYHQEMIPTDLLLAIEATREKVPFPTVVEILIMEISFELIREAGIRIPGPIGPTLGIIGALILGQAAVVANIVSPILIIIVAVTGIGSFAIPSFSLALSFRILRFGYIILGAMAGFLGITTGLFIQGLALVSSKSFGVPFLAPFAPKTAGGLSDEILRAPIWKQEMRPDYVNPKVGRKQPEISRGWTKRDEGRKTGRKKD